jgi:hypothetical protein
MPGGGILPNGTPVDLAAASRVQLEYSLFMGDLILRSERTDLSTRFGNVAFLGVLAGLPAAYAEALMGGRGKFHFRERDDTIAIVRSGELVRVTCTYTYSEIEVERRALAEVLLNFVSESTTHLIRDYPGLLDNSAFLSLIFGH